MKYEAGWRLESTCLFLGDAREPTSISPETDVTPAGILAPLNTSAFVLC
jgi:hypothetical protein